MVACEQTVPQHFHQENCYVAPHEADQYNDRTAPAENRLRDTLKNGPAGGHKAVAVAIGKLNDVGGPDRNRNLVH